MNSTFQFWTVSLVLFFAIYGVLQNPKNSHEMLNFNTIEPREYRLFRRCGAFNRKRWQLALHCHLRSPVPLVVLGFNLKFCSVNPYSTHTANFSKIKKNLRLSYLRFLQSPIAPLSATLRKMDEMSAWIFCAEEGPNRWRTFGGGAAAVCSLRDYRSDIT